VKIDVKEMDVDFLAAGSQKYLLGIPGIAFLYVKKEIANKLKPTLTGWFGRVNPFEFNIKLLDYAEGTRRFETGTPPMINAYTADAAIQILLNIGVERIENYLHKDNILERESGLHRGLTQKKLTMIGLGGAIGTGLFMGSSIAISYAGPAVLISYAIAAFIAVIMMFSLSEMAVAYPTAGSFGVYAEKYLGGWAGFASRWTYWAAQVIAVGGEAVALGIYMTYWFPGIPVWVWTLGFGTILIYVNSRSVENFATFEYWFAMIKVVAIVAFIIFGVSTVMGIGTPAVGFENFTKYDGFMPHGLGGVCMAVLMAVFSFVGVEVIAVTAGENKKCFVIKRLIKFYLPQTYHCL
jgi:amino acid permease